MASLLGGVSIDLGHRGAVCQRLVCVLFLSCLGAHNVTMDSKSNKEVLR